VPERRSASSVGRFLVGLLAASGLALLALGIQRWHSEAAVKRVVDRFVVAVLRGDRTAALDCLAPTSRPTRSESSAEPVWKPTPGFLYRVVQIRVEGDQATARVRLKQSNLYAEPILRLRYRNGQWRITEIERYHFYAFRSESSVGRTGGSAEDLAEELARALDSGRAELTASSEPEAGVR